MKHWINRNVMFELPHRNPAKMAWAAKSSTTPFQLHRLSKSSAPQDQRGCMCGSGSSRSACHAKRQSGRLFLSLDGARISDDDAGVMNSCILPSFVPPCRRSRSTDLWQRAPTLYCARIPRTGRPEEVIAGFPRAESRYACLNVEVAHPFTAEVRLKAHSRAIL